MNGLEKILDKISQDARKEADNILDAAHTKASEIKAESDKKISRECEEINKKALAKVQAIREKSKGTVDLAYRQIILKAKQDLIRETIAASRERLESLSDADYQAFFKELLDNHVPNQDAVLELNERDMRRIPKSVIEDFKQKALKKGATVTLSDEPAGIKNGFILDYGGIEENLSFDALIDQNIEYLEDETGRILFG